MHGLTCWNWLDDQTPSWSPALRRGRHAGGCVERVEMGTVFVPYGPYANHIIDADTHSTGMPDFKSHEVEIEPTDEEPKTVHKLMEDLGGLAYDR